MRYPDRLRHHRRRPHHDIGVRLVRLRRFTVIEEVGIGFASAVLLDALVIRTVLVPARMYLLGRPNSWLPGWSDSVLPHVRFEPDATLKVLEPSPKLCLSTTPKPVAVLRQPEFFRYTAGAS